jgi:hypothetical protein
MHNEERRVQINGRRWRIRLVKSSEIPRDRLGDCDHPPGPAPTIRVRRNLSQRLMLEILLHECLHASRPELDETAIEITAKECAKALYAMGYRRRTNADTSQGQAIRQDRP